MLPTNVMSFMKKMVATEEGANAGAEPPGTFGKLRQTLSSSLLTAQDKVTKLSPRPGVVAETALVEPPPAQPAPVPPPPAKVEREAGKPPSRAGACRVCLKALKPGDVFHTCRDCQHRVCEDCASYSKPTGDDDTISSWRCSVCRRKTAPRVPPAAQDSTDSLLDVPALEALQRRHSEARLGGGGGGGAALAPPRSPELRRHSDVSPASLKELEQGSAASRSNSGDLDGLRRGSGCGGAPAAPAPRRRSMRMPRQRSCDDDKQPPAAPTATAAEGGLGAPPPMPRRASAYDVFTSGGAAPAGTARRASFRGPPDSDTPAAETPAPSKGLSVDEDRPLRRRGSQLPDIAALQRGGALAARVAEIAAESASAAAARQLSVDGEAIKIVIHDVDDNAPRRVVLRRDAADKGHRNRGFGMRVVGGKPDSTGKREAVVVWTVPGGPADIAGLQQGDKVLEWGGVQLTDRSFEEVCSVMERSGSADAIELLIEPSDPASKEEESGHTSTPPSLLVEPDMDKSPSSPTRRKLPKTPV